MATGKFVSYLRVSTDKQGRSGLGLEAQREAVAQYLNGGRWKLVREFVEVESGKRDDRPELTKALHLCKVTGAKLVIAKLDRLSRDAHFLLGLQKAGVPFVAADMPEANEMVVGIMAVVAQAERKMISERTKAALQAAKRRGVKLGNPKGARHLRKLGNASAVAAVRQEASSRAANLRPVVDDIKSHGIVTVRAIADELNARGILTPRGGRWHPTSAARLLKRLDA
jgi:DNA invertase Pin-like site-specific DNA recombinase